MQSRQSKGGRARAEILPPEKRKEIAKAAAAARHDPSIPTATHIGELNIGDLTIPCAVLPDGTRVLSQGGVATAFGPVLGGWQARQRGADDEAGDLPPFLVAKSLREFISNDLRTLVAEPRKYRDPRGGPIRIGFEASFLPKVCEVWLRARDAGALTKIQGPVADRADLLMRGLAHTGIIALVDEVTGYQYQRSKDELQKILSAYISPELLPWAERFPQEYFKEMFRLWGWKWPVSAGPRGPRFAGKLTKWLVYDQLPSGVIEEIQKINPADERWQRRHRNHQHLTAEIGQPHLEKQVAVVTNIMKVCDDKDEFMRKFERAFPGTFDKARQLSFLKELEAENE